MDVRVEVHGMKEFISGLRRLDRKIPGVESDSESTSANLVARSARSRVPSGPSSGGHARASLGAAGSTVSGGGTKYPYYPWLDFGGRVGRNNSVIRPFLKTGRYIFRSFKDNKVQIGQIMDDELTGATRSSGLGGR